MQFTEDKDLSCLMCGKVLVLDVRRQDDTGRDKKTGDSDEGHGRDLDGYSDMDRKNSRVIGSSDNGSTLVRQRSGYTNRRRNLTR
jgi:hypothetical protein